MLFIYVCVVMHERNNILYFGGDDGGDDGDDGGGDGGVMMVGDRSNKNGSFALQI